MPGKVLEIRKHADYSGGGSGPPWPLSHVEVVTDVPDEWSFSDNLIEQGVSEGWIEYVGKPLEYKVFPDPGPSSPTRRFSEQTIKLPGRDLVMHFVRAGKPVAVKFRIAKPPVPRNWRVRDDMDPLGFSVNHSYEVETIGEDKDDRPPPAISGGSGNNEVFNIAKGAFVEKNRDDATKVLLLLIKTVESDANLRDRATVATVVSNSTEADFTNYARKTGITATITVDNTNDRATADIPDQTFTSAGGASNNTLVKAVIAYEETAADSGRVPLSFHSVDVTTDGSDLLIQVNDFARAS